MYEDKCFCSTSNNPPCSFCENANYCENCDTATMSEECPDCGLLFDFDDYLEQKAELLLKELE